MPEENQRGGLPLPKKGELPSPEMIVERKRLPKWKTKSGATTGARVVLLFLRGSLTDASAMQVAQSLDMDPSYARRVLHALANAGILERKSVMQKGTPDVVIFSMVAEIPTTR
jgi:hypothetical protein